MKFTQQALLCSIVASASVGFINAFSPAIISTATNTKSYRTSSSITRYIETQFPKVPTSMRAKLDDDEDDDEDDEDDDDDYTSTEPLGNGVDSVSWLPTVVGKSGSTGDVQLTEKDSEILPLFPLGGIVYTPNSEHILNIFEPRYREMYSDILMNGTKRFAVSMSHPTEPGRFAQMAVLFELQELKEVSEQTGDRIKYICNHKVTGRVKLHRILNPEAWQSRATYLRVEGTLIDDSGKQAKTTLGEGKDENSDEVKMAYSAFSKINESNPTEERALRNAFANLVELQHELEEDVRFTRASVISLAVKPGSGDDGLWQTIKLWQSFADQRLMARQNELQKDFQVKLQEFLKKEKGIKEDELPSAIGFQDLSPALQKDVTELQKRMAMELQPLVLESTLTMQKILEAADHTERVKLVRHFIVAETKRLNTKKAIKFMFAGKAALNTTKESAPAISSKLPASPSLSNIPPEEQILDDKDVRKQLTENFNATPSSFFNDEDAFQ